MSRKDNAIGPPPQPSLLYGGLEHIGVHNAVYLAIPPVIQQPITQSANLQVYALQHRHLHLANSSNSASKPNYLWTIDLRFFGLKNGMHHERIHYTLDDTIAAGFVHALLLGDNLFQCREPGFELGHDDVLRLTELGVKGRAVRAGGHGQLSQVSPCCPYWNAVS